MVYKGTVVSGISKSPGNAMLRETKEDKRYTPRPRLCLDGVLSLREVDVLLLLFLGDETGLVLGESSADGAGLLGSEVQWSVSGGR